MNIVRETIDYHKLMKKKKKKRVVKSSMKSNLENPYNIKKIALLVSLLMKNGNIIELHFPIERFVNDTNLNAILLYLCYCPRQEGVIKCEYFVMGYMKEIIDDPTLIVSKVCV
ncbi:hypothetical protein AAG906_016932 [Vitis piasezkii]